MMNRAVSRTQMQQSCVSTIEYGYVCGTEKCTALEERYQERSCVNGSKLVVYATMSFERATNKELELGLEIRRKKEKRKREKNL